MVGNNSSKHPDCETCDVHPEFSVLINQAITDLGWIKRIGYVLIVLAGSFILSVWSVGYPHLMAVNERLTAMESSMARQGEQIASLKMTTEESKLDRRELRRAIDDLRKSW